MHRAAVPVLMRTLLIRLALKCVQQLHKSLGVGESLLLVKVSFIHRMQQITLENSYDIVVFPVVLHCPCLP
jgi:hypothetical protein